jgi:hypothetical protein
MEEFEGNENVFIPLQKDLAGIMVKKEEYWEICILLYLRKLSCYNIG